MGLPMTMYTGFLLGNSPNSSTHGQEHFLLVSIAFFVCFGHQCLGQIVKVLTVEDASAVKDRSGETDDTLEQLLHLVSLAFLVCTVQFVKVVLAKSQSRHQTCSN